MLRLVPLFEYIYVGCCVMLTNPRWLSLVLRDVGLSGGGDSGDLNGDLRGARGVIGDFNDRTGLDCCVATGAILIESFGLTALDASILTDLCDMQMFN